MKHVSDEPLRINLSVYQKSRVPGIKIQKGTGEIKLIFYDIHIDKRIVLVTNIFKEQCILNFTIFLFHCRINLETKCLSVLINIKNFHSVLYLKQNTYVYEVRFNRLYVSIIYASQISTQSIVSPNTISTVSNIRTFVNYFHILITSTS